MHLCFCVLFLLSLSSVFKIKPLMVDVGGVPPPLQRHVGVRRTCRNATLALQAAASHPQGAISAASCYADQTCEGRIYHSFCIANPGMMD